MKILMTYLFSLFLFSSAQAGIIYAQDFSSNSNGFSGATGYNSSDEIWENNSNKQDLATYLTVNNPFSGQNWILSFDLITIGTWDADGNSKYWDLFSVFFNGNTIFAQRFDNSDVNGTSKVTSLTINAGLALAGTNTFTFIADVTGGDEMWAIDNVSIRVPNAPSWALLVLGLLVLGKRLQRMNHL